MLLVTIEGFNLSSCYIIKELTIIFQDESYQHFRFSPPKDFHPTAAQWRTINYTQSNLNELPLSDNALLPYSSINDIIKKLPSFTIFVAGHITYKVIKEYLPLTKVINICREYNFSYPKELPSTECFSRHRSRYCSLSKAKYIKTILKDLIG